VPLVIIYFTLLYLCVWQCARETGLDIDAIMDCTRSSLGNQLAYEGAEEIAKIHIEYVPFILIDGVSGYQTLGLSNHWSLSIYDYTLDIEIYPTRCIMVG